VRRLILLLLCAAGCSPSSAACRVDTYVASDELGQANVNDCGQFTLYDATYTDEAMAAAQACVLRAVGPTPSPFTLVYDVYDQAHQVQHLRGGYTGALSGGKLRLGVYGFVGDTLGGSLDPRPEVTRGSCQSLTARTNCTPAIGQPCLDCGEPGPTEILCSF
jgi:hypothetical protein